MSRSFATVRLASRSRRASKARCFLPAKVIVAEPSTASSGPRSLNSISSRRYHGFTAQLLPPNRMPVFSGPTRDEPARPKELHVSTTTEQVRNGVDTGTLFATLDAVKAQPELGVFQFRVANTWIDGSHNRSMIKDFYAAGGEDTSRAEAFQLDAGEPAILIGTDTGPNPAEYLLHALAACLTTSLVYVAAARRVRLTRVESTLEGDLAVRGALGLPDEVRNGFEQIRVSFVVEGDAPPEKLRELVERAKARSAVFDMVTNGVVVHAGVA